MRSRFGTIRVADVDATFLERFAQKSHGRGVSLERGHGHLVVLQLGHLVGQVVLEPEGAAHQTQSGQTGDLQQPIDARQTHGVTTATREVRQDDPHVKGTQQ